MAKKPVYDHLKEAMDSSGFEGINLQTMSIPFIRVLQDLSPQLKPNKPEYIEGAVAGQFCNTVSGKLYGENLRMIVGKFERLYIEWGEGRGKFIAAYAPETIEADPKYLRNEKNQLTDPGSGNILQDTYMYYVVLPDHLQDGICIVALSSTGIKEGKKLNRNLTHTIVPESDVRALPYFMVWDMQVTEMSNDKGDWYGLKFVFDDFVTQDMLGAVVEERKALPNKVVDYALLADNTTDEKQPF